MKAFIGHSFDDKDAELIRKLKTFIESTGIECISGEKSQNLSISEKVKQGITSCDLFVGIFTCDKAIASNPTEYTTSLWVAQEAGYAIGQRKDIVFLREEGIRKFPALQGDLETVNFDRNVLDKAYGDLNRQLQDIKTRDNSANKVIDHTEVPNEDRIAELKLKARNYIPSKGYELLPDNHGFDMCAEKRSWLGGTTEYLAIVINLEANVTASYVSDFVVKITEFERNESQRIMLGTTPPVNGLIVYAGELPKNVAKLINGHKEPILTAIS